VNLCLLHGIDLPDPHKLLAGSGNQVRTIRLTSLDMLDDPRIDAIIGEASPDPNRRSIRMRRSGSSLRGTSPKQQSRLARRTNGSSSAPGIRTAPDKIDPRRMAKS